MDHTESTFTYAYPRPAVTVDCVLFGFDKGELKGGLEDILKGLPPVEKR